MLCDPAGSPQLPAQLVIALSQQTVGWLTSESLSLSPSFSSCSDPFTLPTKPVDRGTGWHVPVIPALGRRGDHKVKAITLS